MIIIDLGDTLIFTSHITDSIMDFIIIFTVLFMVTRLITMGIEIIMALLTIMELLPIDLALIDQEVQIVATTPIMNTEQIVIIITEVAK